MLIQSRVKKVFMWTVGSSMQKEQLPDFKLMVRDFFKKLNTYSDRQMSCEGWNDCPNNHFPYWNVMYYYDPYAYCIEEGTKGFRLHAHIIFGDYLPHGLVLDLWRNITGEKSNVNFVRSRKNSIYGAVNYISKYLSKDSIVRKMKGLYGYHGKFKLGCKFVDPDDFYQVCDRNMLYDY